MKALGVRVAARLEQEIRSYPRLHRGFYVLITRNPVVRDLAGRVKDRVRGSGDTPTAEAVPAEPADLQARRLAGVAARLGLRTGEQP